MVHIDTPSLEAIFLRGKSLSKLEILNSSQGFGEKVDISPMQKLKIIDESDTGDDTETNVKLG